MTLATNTNRSCSILQVGDIAPRVITKFLNLYPLDIEWLAAGAPINGSFWGAPEAGIVGSRVLVRPDTPIHSFLHETSHIICMAPEIRASHSGNAGSDDLEESAVCYLQILLADCLPGVGRRRLMQDMDTWGYSFRLGSTRNWFAEDAEDAREWLVQRQLIDEACCPTFNLRGRVEDKVEDTRPSVI